MSTRPAIKPKELLPRLPWLPSQLIRLLVKFPKTNIGVCLRIRFMLKHLHEHAKWMKKNAPYGTALDDEILSGMFDFNQEMNSHIAWVRKTGTVEGEDRISNMALVLFEREYRRLYEQARKTWTPESREKLRIERTAQEFQMAPMKAIMDEMIADMSQRK